ncbi:MAG: flagellar hook-associated protein FlgK [Planctomycetota bacterium]
MALGGSLQIGQSGLLASQAALEVVGNNLANVATPGYHRLDPKLVALPGREAERGVQFGGGVNLDAITRVVDEALEGRLRGTISDESGASTLVDLLAQIEAIENELSDVDLSTRLTAFFNAWSDLSNNPQDLSLRTLVIQEGESLARFVNDLDTGFKDTLLQTDVAIEQAVGQANDILERIETLNTAIAIQEGGAGEGAHGLRDERTLLLEELSQLVDISVVEQPSGRADIFVGSLPIMLNGQSRGLEARQQTVDGELVIDVVIADDQSPIDTSAGQLGALVEFRKVHLDDAINALDQVASQLIWQVNRIHSQSQGLDGFTSVTATNAVDDSTVTLDDLTNNGLDFAASHGSFRVHLTQLSTGARTTSTVAVDLDGIDPTNDTTLASLAADLDAIAGVSASIGTDGRLTIAAENSGFEISFSDDTSGALAALGVNTYFTGSDAFDIGVNSAVSSDPAKLAAARDHLPGSNTAALAIAQLRDGGIDELDGLSLTQAWSRHVEDFAGRSGQASQRLESAAVVKANLAATQQSISGVNADEETIELIRYQRAYQASARFISTVDELMQTLLSII